MLPKKSESTREAEFEHTMNVIENFEVATIFEELNLTRIGCIISMNIEELKDLSFTPLGENEPLTLDENKIC